MLLIELAILLACIVIGAWLGEIALGLPASMLIGVYPAVNGNSFLPTYGTVLAQHPSAGPRDVRIEPPGSSLQ